ncbi:hypothetical protein ACIQ9Q_13890 [Streptomyces sp. NPDC094438]|uniref:hypothetical protein n=1 Tax=Streptomyces sp. NPDC094438 TaxID=3366061 RepID=UPI00381E2700
MTPTTLMFTTHERRVLDFMAQGLDVQGLVRQGLYPTERAVWRGVTELGGALSGGEIVRWSRIVHLAVIHNVVTIRRTKSVVLPEFQLDLLRALAAGLRLVEYADKSDDMILMEVKELLVLLCSRLSANGPTNAVYRGHQAGLLTPDDPLHMTFGKAVSA